MPQRAMNVMWGILGLVAVAGLVLVGLDAARAAACGPAWRRRLLGAGLVLLAALGASSCSKTDTQAPTSNPPSIETLATMPLEETGEWKNLTSAWAEGSEVASGRRGMWPFDKAGKERLVAALQKASADVERLYEAKLLSASETDILSSELTLILDGVGSKRTTEERNYSCYEVMRIATPAEQGLKNLAERVPLIEKMVASDRLAPAAARKVLEAMERDIEAVTKHEIGLWLKGFNETQRAEAARLSEAAAAQAVKLKERLDAGKFRLEEAAEWKNLAWAWAEGTRIGEGERWGYPFDAAGKKKLLDALERAMKDLDTLRARGLLSGAETAFLAGELAQLTQGVRLRRATEERMAECYKPMALPAREWQALGNLAERLPLVEKMLASGTLSRAAASKVFETMTRDIGALGSDEAIRKLPESERARASELVKTAREATGRVFQRLLPRGVPEPTCYVPMMLPERSMRGPAELEAQLALLERMSASGALSPGAAEKARDTLANEMRRIAGGQA